jgi:hypothetical protein
MERSIWSAMHQEDMSLLDDEPGKIAGLMQDDWMFHILVECALIQTATYSHYGINIQKRSLMNKRRVGGQWTLLP